VIYIVAPISQAANIYMTFTLPNGEPLFGDVLEKVSKGEEVGDDVRASYVFTLPDGALSVWRYRVPASVTRLAGVVQYTIVTVTDSMRPTASGTFTVSRGNRLILPNDPNPDAWNRILEALGYKNADIDQLLEEIYGAGGTLGDAKEGGILDRVQKLEERDDVNSTDIAELQQKATYLGKVDRAMIGEVPSLELADVDTPLSVVLAKAQEYWNDQEPQVVVSGPAEFRVFEGGVFRDVEIDVPPFTRISFTLGGNVPRGTAYLPNRVVDFEVAGDIADNTVMITRDVTLEGIDKKVSDNREELDFLDENAATDLSVGLTKKDELSGKEYILRIQIKNRYGDILSNHAIDLPLEMAFVGAKISEDGTDIIFELQNGKTVELPVDSIVGKFNIVQGTGNGTDAVMSQDATTKALDGKLDKPEDGVEFVKTTDYATPKKRGIVIPSAVNGTGTNAIGQLYLIEAFDAELSAKTNHYKPVTPANLDYAVKVGVTTNTITLTEAEKQSAQTWLGVKSELDMLKKAAEGKLYVFKNVSNMAPYFTVPSNLMSHVLLKKVSSVGLGTTAGTVTMEPYAGTYSSTNRDGTSHNSATISYDAVTGIFTVNGSLAPTGMYENFDGSVEVPTANTFTGSDFMNTGTISITCVGGSFRGEYPPYGGFNGAHFFEFPVNEGDVKTSSGQDYPFVSDSVGAVTQFGLSASTTLIEFDNYQFTVDVSVEGHRLDPTPVTTITSDTSGGTRLETFHIPDEIKALPGYGKTTRADTVSMIDFENKVFIQNNDVDGTPLETQIRHDISAYLKDGDDEFEVSAGGKLTFVNESNNPEAPVQYTVFYQQKL
jgi:hypothetical protein